MIPLSILTVGVGSSYEVALMSHLHLGPRHLTPFSFLVPRRFSLLLTKRGLPQRPGRAVGI